MALFVTDDGYLVDLDVSSLGDTIHEIPSVERLLVEPLPN